MMRTSPLMDCTRDTLQAMNRSANLHNTSATKLAKTTRHDPYATKLLAPEDSVDFNGSLFSTPFLSSRPSPLNWEARAFEPSFTYSNLSTPFFGNSLASLSLDAQVRRSLFGDSPGATTTATTVLDTPAAEPVAALQPSEKPTPAPATPGSPKKAIAKIYVGGRPVVVPRYDNEVSVKLRHSETTFVVPDMHHLLASEEETRDMVNLAVIVEGDRGEDLGVITAVLRFDAAASKAEEGKKEKEQDASSKPLPRILRIATALELQQSAALPQREAEALEYCHACLAEVQLAVPITVEGVVFQFDRKKLTVRYTSDAYVDFNDLTRMLHKKFNCRIWMDQLNREAVNSSNSASGGSGEKRGRRAEPASKKAGGAGQRKAAQKRKGQ